jgi:hypothetical protein
MRTLRLARVAAEAERIRLRGLIQRLVIRAVCGAIALLFAVGAIVFAHLAGWYWLRTALQQSFLAATGMLGGGDLLVAILLAFLATRSTPSRVEIQALEVRRQAIRGIGNVLSLAQLTVPMLRIIANLRRPRRD